MGWTKCQLCEDCSESRLLADARRLAPVAAIVLDPTLELRLTKPIAHERQQKSFEAHRFSEHGDQVTLDRGVFESFMNGKPHALFLAGAAQPRTRLSQVKTNE